MNPKTYVDIEFVKSLDILPAHDVAAVEAIYPGTFEASAERVSRRFDDRAIASGEKETVQRHIAALVAAEMKKKRGSLDEGVETRIESAANEANAWLAESQSLTEARKSAAPPPSPLADAVAKTVSTRPDIAPFKGDR